MKLHLAFAGLLASAAIFVGCETNQVMTVPVNSVSTSAQGDTLVVDVPEMHCPFACWPAVEKTLVEQPGVLDVELAPQKDEDAIDNPRVYVSVSEDFDSEKALAALASAGFADSKVAAEN